MRAGHVLRGGGWALVAFPLLALGGQTVADDFESGHLLQSESPPGAWTTLDIQSTQVTVAPSAAAAHRGDSGLRVVDNDGRGGAGVEGALDFSVSPAATGEYYFRQWFRLTSSNDQGSVALGQLYPTAGGGLCDVVMDFPGGAVSLEGSDLSGMYTRQDTGVRWTVGTWHLIELGAAGIGTSAGVRRLWLDGTLVAERGALNWQGVAVSWLYAAEHWSGNQLFVGVLDFDDLRTSTAPPASTLALAASAGGVEVGACVPVTCGLRDSSGAAATAPYDTDVSLGLTAGSGTFHADASCRGMSSAVHLAAGARSGTAWFQPALAGTATIGATHPDFLTAAPVTLSVVDPNGADAGSGAEGEVDGGGVDGGTSEGKRSMYALSCRSEGTAGGISALAVVLVAAVRRRARAPAG